tara:strand:- start:18746 stop:20026 length:1281 start_codon:yes stop_codon:yes gene_type:complete
MASNYTALGVQLMTTGEKAGTWGTLTNTNWDIIEQISGGYVSIALNTTGATTLAVSDGAATDANQVGHRILNFTAALGGNVTVTIPLDVEQFYIIKNATTEAYTVEFKYVTGSGSSVTWAAGDKGTKIIYATANDGTNPDIVDTGFLSAVVDDTSPQLGGDLDVNGQDIVSTSDADISIIPNGTGDVNLGADAVQLGDLNADATLTTQGTGDLILNTNNGTNAGSITLADGVDGDINIAPNGSGEVQAGGAVVKNAGTETIFVPAQGMFSTTTNGAAAAAVETTATRPEMKVLDFDASTNEYSQFSIAMPKSWNEGTLTFQAFWSPSSTDTGNALIGLQGVSVVNDATSDVVFGTAIYVTDAGGGAVEDVLVSPVSAAVTVAAAAVDTYTYFQVVRNASDGSDTFTGDVRLLGIKIFYTSDAANDA